MHTTTIPASQLVDAVDAPLLDAVGPLLLAEAGGVGGKGLGQGLLGDDLVDEFADHGVLAGADKIEVLASILYIMASISVWDMTPSTTLPWIMKGGIQKVKPC